MRPRIIPATWFGSEVKAGGAVKLIANPTNCGFARAVNQGVVGARYGTGSAVESGYRAEDIHCGVGERLPAGRNWLSGGASWPMNTGQPQRGFTLRRFPRAATLIFEVLGINRLFPLNPLNRSYRCLDLDLSQPAEVEQPPGAFLMFRREVWQRLGGFDTQFYPLWFEDVDFCKRARDLGLKIQYVPEVTGLHQGGHSIASLDWECREVFWYVSLLRYASKHFAPVRISVGERGSGARFLVSNDHRGDDAAKFKAN